MHDILSELPTIITERLVLRPLTMADDEAIYAYGSDPEVSRYVSFDTHRSIEDARVFLRSVLESYAKGTDPSSFGIVLKEKETLIGTIGYLNWSDLNKRIEIGYALSRPHWNLGYVTEATKAMIGYFFQHSDLIRIEARCTTQNIASSRVMEKAGMSFEGILRKQAMLKGEHHDMKIYSIIRDEWQRENNH
ncbi:MAG: GNAT family N-acetyltransferase [Candidatus Kapaibacterium sp.]